MNSTQSWQVDLWITLRQVYIGINFIDFDLIVYACRRLNLRLLSTGGIAPTEWTVDGDFNIGMSNQSDTTQQPPLEKRATFLVHRINAQLQQICNPVIAPYNLDLYSSRILVAVQQFGTVKVGKLVHLMALPQSTISHQLKRLEKVGYVHRTRSEVDNRSVEITLTPDGERVALVCNRLSDVVYGPVMEKMSQQESEKLIELLEKMFVSLPPVGEVSLEN